MILDDMNTNKKNTSKKSKTQFIEIEKISNLGRIQRYVQFYTDCAYDLFKFDFPKKYKKDIIDAVTMEFISRWMEESYNTRQTKYSFIKKPFKLYEGENEQGIDSDEHNKLNYCSTLLDNNLRAQIEYAKANGFVYRELPNKPLYGDRESFLELEFEDALGKGYLEVYRNIFKNKTPYKSTSDSFPRDRAEEDYAAYQSYCDKILLLIEKEGKKATKDNRAFVVKCILVWKLECAYRFILTSKIAEKLKDSKIPIDKVYVPELISGYCCSYPLPYNKIYLNRSYFIKNYDELISRAYSNKSSRDIKYVEGARALATMVYARIHKAFKIYPIWTDKDFEDVAIYLIKEYKITKCLKFPKFCNKNNKIDMMDKLLYYNYIRALFNVKNYLSKGNINFLKDVKNNKE